MAQKKKQNRVVEPLPKPDAELQAELDKPVDLVWVQEQLDKIPRLEKQRIETLVEGLFLFAPEDFLNGGDDEEDAESDSEVTKRYLEDKYKPKKQSAVVDQEQVVVEEEKNKKAASQKTKKTTEPLNNNNNNKVHQGEDSKEETGGVELKKDEKSKFPPKFHLEPVPAEFLPENADPEKLSPEDFKDRFQRMREYMTARRKAINQDEKRKRREERKQKKKPKKNNTPPVDAAVIKPQQQHNKAILTKIVKDEDLALKKKKAGPNPKQALEKLKLEQEKLELLKKQDPEAAAKLLEKSALKRALAKARGESVKDDAGRLKKTIQRQEKEKKKSEKKWRETKYQVKKAQKSRVEKREKNIKERIEKIKTKKQKFQKKRR